MSLFMQSDLGPNSQNCDTLNIKITLDYNTIHKRNTANYMLVLKCTKWLNKRQELNFLWRKIPNKFLLSLDFQRLSLIYFLSEHMCMCMLQCACGGWRLSCWRRFSPVSVPRIEFRSIGSAASALTCWTIPPASKCNRSTSGDRILLSTLTIHL